jgi:AcrR family transcriptional regulator
MPRVTEEHRVARRTEILTAACRCFARDGFHATSIADIISESGLSAGSVYLYFKSKNDLIAAVVDMTLSSADAIFADLLADDAVPSPEQTVTHVIDAIMKRAVDHPLHGVDISRVALHAWAEALRDPEIAGRIEHAMRGLRRHYADVVRRCQGAGLIDPHVHPEDVGTVLLGVVQAFAVQRLLIPGTDSAQYLSGLHALLSVPSSPTAAPGPA